MDPIRLFTVKRWWGASIIVQVIGGFLWGLGFGARAFYQLFTFSIIMEGLGRFILYLSLFSTCFALLYTGFYLLGARTRAER